jgi:4-amino-4-deoxy-L-arabinose transferase-like glycosyltransferase
VLLLLVAVAAFLRLHQLDSIPPGLYADEAFNGNEAVAAWRTGHFHVYYPENHGQEGLLIALQAVAFGITGQARPWVVRLPGALLGVGTTLGMYALARQLGFRRAAWLSAWMMATSFWHISMSRTVDLRVAPVFFLVWSVWLWGEAQQRKSLIWAGWAGLIYALGFYTYQAYRVTPLLLLVAGGCRPGRRPTWRVATAAAAVAALTLVPLAVFAVSEPAAYFYRMRELQTMATPHSVGVFFQTFWRTLGMFHLAGDLNPRHNLPGQPLLFWPVGVLFLTGIFVALRRQRFLLWWLGVGLLPAILINEGVPHSGRAALAIPAVFLLAGLGAEWAAERLDRWRAPAAPILMALLAMATAVQGYRQYFVVWSRDPRVAEWFDASLPKVAAQLNELPTELPKYVILEPDPTVAHGLPVAAETIKFLTDTATPERQAAKNLRYLWPNETNQIALGYVAVYHIETTQP